MTWLWIPILIWLIALLIMVLPKYIHKKVQRLEAELKVEAQLAKNTNPDESIYKNIENSMLHTFTIQNLYLSSSIIGSILIALGFLALCFVLLL